MQRGLNVTHYLYATFYTISYNTRCSGASRRNLHASWNSLQKGCCTVFATVQYWLADITINWTEKNARCFALTGLWLWKKKYNTRGAQEYGLRLRATNDVLNHGASSIRFRILPILPSFCNAAYSCEWHPDGDEEERRGECNQAG